MEQPRLWYVNVFVSDIERALAFYRDTLKLPVQLEDAEFGYAFYLDQLSEH